MEPYHKRPRLDDGQSLNNGEKQGRPLEMPDFNIHAKETSMYQCKFCPEAFQFFISLSCHMHIKHNLNANTSKEPICEICHEKFQDDESKISHMNEVHFSTTGENIIKNETGVQSKPNLLLKINVKEDAQMTLGSSNAL